MLKAQSFTKGTLELTKNKRTGINFPNKYS